MDPLKLLNYIRPAGKSIGPLSVLYELAAPYIPVRDMARGLQSNIDPEGQYSGVTQELLDLLRMSGAGSFHERDLTRESPTQQYHNAWMANYSGDNMFGNPDYDREAKMAAWRQAAAEKQQAEQMQKDYQKYQQDLEWRGINNV